MSEDGIDFKTCSSDRDSISQVEWVEDAPTVFMNFMREGKPSILNCYDGSNLSQWLDNKDNWFVEWIKNPHARRFDDEGHGGMPKPNSDIYVKIYPINQFILKDSNMESMLRGDVGIWYDLQYMGMLRLGNTEGSVGVSQLHGQAPGQLVYKIKSIKKLKGYKLGDTQTQEPAPLIIGPEDSDSDDESENERALDVGEVAENLLTKIERTADFSEEKLLIKKLLDLNITSEERKIYSRNIAGILKRKFFDKLITEGSAEVSHRLFRYRIENAATGTNYKIYLNILNSDTKTKFADLFSIRGDVGRIDITIMDPPYGDIIINYEYGNYQNRFAIVKRELLRFLYENYRYIRIEESAEIIKTLVYVRRTIKYEDQVMFAIAYYGNNGIDDNKYDEILEKFVKY
jgi:hypothetical protein